MGGGETKEEGGGGSGRCQRSRWAVDQDGAPEVAATFLTACLCDGDYMHEEAWSDRTCLVMTTRHLSDDDKKQKRDFSRLLNVYERLHVTVF